MNQSKMHINLATMSRVVLDETPAFEQLIQHFCWGTRNRYAYHNDSMSMIKHQ